MRQEIKKYIQESLQEIIQKENLGKFSALEFQVFYPPQEKFGDLTTNVALILASKLPLSSLDLAQKIKNELEVKIKSEKIKKIEIVKPGYINFFYTQKYWQEKVTIINKQGEKFGDSKINYDKFINNEFISANPTGPLHLGNGRGGYWGDVLSNVWKTTGAQVVNEYYINDAGEQILKLGHSVLKDKEAVYQGGYIDKLNKKIPSNIKNDYQKIGKWAAQEILKKEIKPVIKDKMNINIDSWISEKNEIIKNGWREKALQILREKKLTYQQDGAEWFQSSQFGDEKDRVLIKKDGSKTYFASDCGYVFYKINQGYNYLVEIWGADHHGYIQRFQAVAKALGFQGKIKFIITQLVRLIENGEEVKMSKRKGNVIYIEDLINKVGSDVVRFFFLMRSVNTHLDFDLKLAQEKSNQNPVYYIQYVLARSHSISEKIKKINLEKDELDLSLLQHDKEIALIKQIYRLPEVLKEISENLEVHRLTHYAISLADYFHSFYEVCKIIDEKNIPLTQARYELVLATENVLKKTLKILGIKRIKKM